MRMRLWFVVQYYELSDALQDGVDDPVEYSELDLEWKWRSLH
jgi:hypothetical protein